MTPKILAVLLAADAYNGSDQNRHKTRTGVKLQTTLKRITRLKYLFTWVGSVSSVLYHPPAHLTAFGTPCCKLMTLGFLTPDPHLNRNQPRAQQKNTAHCGRVWPLSQTRTPGNFTCTMAKPGGEGFSSACGCRPFLVAALTAEGRSTLILLWVYVWEVYIHWYKFNIFFKISRFLTFKIQ